ncbi:MAG: glycosyltransferase family 4 protein [Phycisphaerae bacterium]
MPDLSDENTAAGGSAGADRLLAVNQVVGPLMAELLSDLVAGGMDCSVVAGWVDRRGGEATPFGHLPAARLVKSPAWQRMMTWSAFTAGAAARIAARRSEPLLVTTNPPLMPLLMPALKRLLGCRYVLLVYDVYPEVAERTGYLRPGGRAAELWRRLSRRSMLAADGVITLGEHMAETLRNHLRPGDECDIEVIPNWADTDFIRPIPKQDNPFARRHGLTDKLVVGYSGSFGATHDTESIIAAAGLLADVPDVRLLLIGGGTRRREVEQLVAERNPGNLTLLDFQPLEVLPQSLAAMDCAVVCLDEPYRGVSVPSKTYYALAAGAAVLAVSPPNTELTDLVAEHGCGVHIPPRSGEKLAAAVREMHENPALLRRYRLAARKAAQEHFSRGRAVERYRRYLRDRFSPGGSQSPPRT